MANKELDLLVKSAEDLCDKEQYHEAISIGAELVNRWPRNMLSYYIRGRIRWGINDLDNALSDINKAIKLDPNFSKSWHYKGNIFLSLKRFEESLICFDRALELNPEYTYAFNGKGNSLCEMKRYEEALVCYDRAISLDPNDADPYNNKGTVLKKQMRNEEALSFYSKAIEICPKSRYFNNRGYLYFTHDDFDHAEADFLKSVEIYPSGTYAQSMLKKIGVLKKLKAEPLLIPDNTALIDNSLLTNAYKAVERFRAEEDKVDDSSDIASNEFHIDLIRRIQEFHNNERQQLLEKSIERNIDSFRRFTSIQRTPDNLDKYEFYVLRRWNSYTPIVSHNNGASKGGGYFLHTGETGVVLDPGFNFIENFQECGFSFSQIGKVFITHAHNDHDADLESILTLLYVYNRDIKKSIIEDLCKEVQSDNYPQKETSSEEDIYKYLKKEKTVRFYKERKVIDIYLTCGAFKKHAARLDLRRDGEYRVHIIKANDKEVLLTKDTTIRAIKAKHFDLMSDCDAVGFVIEFPNSVIVYTGDTGFSTEIGKQYRELREEFKGKEKPVALLAHLGGFKSREKNTNVAGLVSGKSFYKDHLGRNGLICLVNDLHPDGCIVSEFGEEFAGYRIEVAELFSKTFKDMKVSFIPADIGLCVNSDFKIWSIINTKYGKGKDVELEREFLDPSQVSALEQTNGSLSYFLKSINNSENDLNRLRVDIERANETGAQLRPLHPPAP